MQALPAAPASAPQRQMLVGISLAGVAMIMMAGSMLGVWLLQRTRSIDDTGSWVPDGVTIPEVPTNVMLIAFIGICVFAQWAVYSAKRADHGHAAFALACTAFLAVLVINAQAFVYHEMGLGIGDGTYQTMFYAITGLFVLLMIIGVVFSVVTAFRYIGGRVHDHEIVAAHAIYWYTTAVVFAAVWLVVYVTK